MSAKSHSVRNIVLTGSACVCAILLVLGIMSRGSTTASALPETIAQQDTPIRLSLNAPVLAPTPTSVSADLRAQADAMQQVMINVYQRVDPAVVNIEITTDNTDTIDASGSGFVIDTEGHIVTNNHVVRQARELNVTFYDGYTATAKLVGNDDFSDLAVIQVNVPKEHLIPVTFGDSSSLQVGQRVIAIGNPFGLLSSMTTGIVSATGRTLNSARLSYRNPSIIQTDAQINPGNSGGPLLDLGGNVIGVNTAISSDSGTFQGVGFAVPSNTVKRVIPQLIKSGKAEYAWLGITAVGGREGISVAALAERLKLPVNSGILISEVVADSPAEQAGLRGGNKSQSIRGVEVPIGGDIIVAINGQPLRDMDALLAYLVANAAPGDIVTLTIVRDNTTIDVKVTLKVRPVSAS
ncbi:MAG: trypsin-like peptidase domain-containing protein [Chloroflexota bacterium]